MIEFHYPLKNQFLVMICVVHFKIIATKVHHDLFQRLNKHLNLKQFHTLSLIGRKTFPNLINVLISKGVEV